MFNINNQETGSSNHSRKGEIVLLSIQQLVSSMCGCPCQIFVKPTGVYTVSV